MKSVRIRSFSGSYFPAFGLNTERYSVSLRIQSECGKMRSRITPNTDTFYIDKMAGYKSLLLASTNVSMREYFNSNKIMVEGTVL